MSTQAYIEDGYTEVGFMKEVSGVHQACRFSFRPVLATSVRSTLDRWSEIAPELKSSRINNLIKDHVTEWDLTHNGNILPITIETLERLKQPFVDRMFNIITYSDSSDASDSARQREEDAKN